MQLTITFTDDQKAGLLNALRSVNLQIRQQNLQIQASNLQGNGEAQPEIPEKTLRVFLGEVLNGFANSQYDNLFNTKGQRAMEAFRKLPAETQDGLLATLGVPNVVDLNDWDES